MELMAVRSMLEIECAGFAAESITPSELEELDRCIQLLMGINEGTITEEADHVYHSLIAKSSHNNLLYYLYSSIHEVVSHHIVTMGQMILEDSANSKILATQHNNIFQAVFHKNCDQARQAMRVHMRFVHDQLCQKLYEE